MTIVTVTIIAACAVIALCIVAGRSGLLAICAAFVVGLTYALKGVSGGVIDLVGLLEPPRDTRYPLGPPTPMANSPSLFEAWCACPRCEHFDAHWIHVPVEIPADVTVRDSAPYRIANGTEFHVFGGRQPDLNKWNVIRECRSCGQEWGQL